ncbi:hypothetical protein BCR44DRAFT_41925 [Catenaria anguillulae PL171]|uniref:Chitin-binding type-4 domain-containing protein n=1 Tax=Catenaria anguillulae PL171 TaxID=765915 RepID=A0A1Y2HRX8_9FUNG|nr:hypothetical protein BCR44DRAFT_41925 [Catenaria anguillulae PL171]
MSSTSIPTLLALLCLAAVSANAHMLMALPSTWGLTTDLENPLNAGTPNFFCHGRQRPVNGPVTQIQAGGKLRVPIVCGEAIGNPQAGGSTCVNDGDGVNDYHQGGGCALSIAYTNDPKSVAEFTLFSVNHDCPKVGQSEIEFDVPGNLPAGDATMAWTWIPPASAATDEMYMNCASVRVNGQAGRLEGGRQLTNHMYAVPGFGTRNPRPIYRDVLPNGALQLSVRQQ